MKKILTAAFLSLLLCISAFGQDDAQNNKEVIDFDIPFFGKIQPVNVSGDDALKDFKIRRSYVADRDLLGFGFGLIYTNTDKPLDFNVSRSIEIMPFCFDANTHFGRHTLSAGIGILSRNFTQTGETRLSRVENGEIIAGPYPAGSVPKLSRLSVFSLIVPFQYTFNISNGFGFSFGPVVDINTKSVLKAKYSIDSDKHKDKYKFVHTNPVTVDLMARLNLRYCAFYVKYSPMDLMDEQWWPGMHQQLSFGVIL